MRQSIARVAGYDASGEVLLDFDISLPPPAEVDCEASEAQLDALKRFYGDSFPRDVTGEQAHQLLSVRDLAKATVARLFDVWGKRAHPLELSIAAFLLSDDDLVKWTVKYLQDRFDRGADPDTLPRSIGRLPWFVLVEDFAHDVYADLKEAGVKL